MKIKSGFFYKTSDGRKVGPMVAQDGYHTIEGYHYASNGECCFYGQSGNTPFPERDLIAEWVDEPVAVAPATATFKAGDRVNYKDACVSGVGVIHSPTDEEGEWHVTVEEKDREWAYFINGTARKFYERSLSPATITVGDWVRTDGGDIGIVLHDDGTDIMRFKVGYVGDYDETWDWFSDLQLTIVPPGTTTASNDNSALLAEIDELERRLSDLRARAAA